MLVFNRLGGGNFPKIHFSPYFRRTDPAPLPPLHQSILHLIAAAGLSRSFRGESHLRRAPVSQGWEDTVRKKSFLDVEDKPHVRSSLRPRAHALLVHVGFGLHVEPFTRPKAEALGLWPPC